MQQNGVGKKMVKMPEKTGIGALHEYITTSSSKNFQPMNVNFGLLPKSENRIKGKKERYKFLAERALEELEDLLRRKKCDHTPG
jgi:methylenetetrahydrofolate--tRNA-(uracil-5-)-methyltransferase